jgi:deoxycytidine triphosphate deaminase
MIKEEKPFTQKELDNLLGIPANSYLKKPAKEKHADFVGIDPFPNISASLLNSKDIIQYILTTGMVDPFIPENIRGATYTCCFSGEYIYWDVKRIKHRDISSKEKGLIIKPNSVVFLGIKGIFFLPEYMVLRFNLRVKNVYKGLLLGTGPIVDPGYVGQLFIPLHNFTSNEYFITIDAHLIDIEFTKLSKNNKWNLNKNTNLGKIVNSLDFTNITYIAKYFEEGRIIDNYIDVSLVGDSSFCKKDAETIFINSSAEEEIEKNKELQKRTNDKIKELDHFKTFLTITIVSVVIAAVSLFASTGWYFSKATDLSEAAEKIENQKSIIEQQLNDFNIYKRDTKEIIDILERRLHILEIKTSK